MASPINEQLKAIADNSALKQSLVPVLVCDENFTVCTKSVGAMELFKKPAVRNSILPGLDEGIAEKLTVMNEGAVFTTYRRISGISYVVLTAGTVDGQRYYTMIVQPKISFCPVIEPWYLTTTFSDIRACVNQLISSPPGVHHKLGKDCTRLARLCTFTSDESMLSHSLGAPKCWINHILRSILSESQQTLNLIGGCIDTEISERHNYFTHLPEKELYILLTTLTVALMLVSKRNHAVIGCEQCGRESGTLTVYVSVDEPYDGAASLRTFDELIHTAEPISLELSALSDMAAKSDLKLECCAEDGRLTVSFRVSGIKTLRTAVKKPSFKLGAIYKELFAALWDTVREHLV